MRVVVISDPHVASTEHLLFGVDTGARLKSIVAQIEAHVSMGSLCVLLGDLVNCGTVAEYERLRDILQGLRMPWQAVIGNHDNRDNFHAVFGNHSSDANGFVQTVLELSECRLVFLDTFEPKKDYGVLCARRLAWVEATLSAERDRPTYIFMHHPPHRLSIRVDRNSLVNPWEFGKIIRRNPQVRGIFTGHVHLQSSGHWLGVPITTFAAPYRNRLYGHRDATGRELRDLASQYLGTIDFSPDQAVVHSLQLPLSAQL